ncbi:MAG: exodeoxyribonuclease VII large subunit [Gaiellaceae bacterium]
MELASQTAAISVAEYSARIGHALRQVGPAVIEGEVQKPKVSPRGMLWFDLTDGEAGLSCKVFSRQAARLSHMPRHGDLVEVMVDRPDLWAEKGKLDLIVSDVRLTGEGELLRRREALLAKLRDEGLCDESRRKPLPGFPRAVGVIAGRGSDGMSDVIQALCDRFPPVHVVTCGATVQGRAAPRDLIDALAWLQEHPLVDVIVLARGGGSVQDLVAFDDERLCRAIFACTKPVIAAIGHTDNVPVCNHVTWAAYTPSRSAELAVPSAASLLTSIEHCSDALVPDIASLAVAVTQTESVMERALRRIPSTDQIRLAGAALDARAESFFRVLGEGLRGERLRLDRASEALARVGSDIAERDRRLDVGIRRQLADHERDYGHALTRLVREAGSGARRRLGDSIRGVAHLVALVDAHDFRRRGWVLAADEQGQALSSVERLRTGARVRLNFGDGQAAAAIQQVSKHGKEAG